MAETETDECLRAFMIQVPAYMSQCPAPLSRSRPLLLAPPPSRPSGQKQSPVDRAPARCRRSRRREQPGRAPALPPPLPAARRPAELRPHLWRSGDGGGCGMPPRPIPPCQGTVRVAPSRSPGRGPPSAPSPPCLLRPRPCFPCPRPCSLEPRLPSRSLSRFLRGRGRVRVHVRVRVRARASHF